MAFDRQRNARSREVYAIHRIANAKLRKISKIANENYKRTRSQNTQKSKIQMIPFELENYLLLNKYKRAQ